MTAAAATDDDDDDHAGMPRACVLANERIPPSPLLLLLLAPLRLCEGVGRRPLLPEAGVAPAGCQSPKYLIASLYT